jgi:hypothetical protein
MLDIKQRYLLGTAPGFYQDILTDAGVFASKDIGKGITDQDGSRKINFQLGRGLKDQSGQGLPALTGLFGSMGTKIKGIYPPTLAANFSLNAEVQFVSGFQADQASANRGLIGDDYNLDCRLDETKGFESLWIKGNISPAADIAASIFDNHAISIEKDRFLHHPIIQS